MRSVCGRHWRQGFDPSQATTTHHTIIFIYPPILQLLDDEALACDLVAAAVHAAEEALANHVAPLQVRQPEQP